MKTSHLVAIIIALAISAGGIEGINFLFTQAYQAHQPTPVELSLPA